MSAAMGQWPGTVSGAGGSLDHGSAHLRVRPISIVDAVVIDLRERILRAAIPAGSPLTEADVARQYDVARPTAKAAIEALVGSGLVARTQHKTARVIDLGPGDVRDIYRSRATLESQVLRELAATSRDYSAARAANAEIAAVAASSPLDIVEPDMRFHTSLVDAFASQRISRMYHSLATEVRLCMARVQGRGLLPHALIVEEHERILTALEAGDGNRAVALLGEHLGRARERLVGALGGEAGPEADLEPAWERGADDDRVE